MRSPPAAGSPLRRDVTWTVATLILVAALAGCSSAAGATGRTPSPSSAAKTVVDVGDYRGGIARSGTMPGPGPASRPAQAWRYIDSVGLNYPAIVASGWVIVPAQQSVVALDARTGASAWELALPADVAAPLTVAGGLLYVPTSDGILRAFSLATRLPLWTFSGVIDGSQVSVSGSTVYVGTKTHELAALDARDGRPLWTVRAPTSTAKIAIRGDVAIVGGDGGSRATAVDLRNHSVRWVFDTKAQAVATPVLADGSAYVAGRLSGGLSGAVSRLYCLDLATGSVRWTFSPPANVPMAAFAVSAHDVVVGSDNDEGVVFDLDRATGRIQWQSVLGTAIDRPVIVGSTVYVGTGTGGLHALALATGHELWKVDVAGFSEGVVVTGGSAFVTTHDAPDAPGSVTAFAAPS